MRRHRSKFLIILSLLLLAACTPLGAGSSRPETESTSLPTLAQTLTRQAETEVDASPAPTAVPATSTPTLRPSPTQPALAPTKTPTPQVESSPTPTHTLASEQPCLQATLLEDVTVPDGSVLNPGEIFLKIWRLQNTGSCAWQWGRYWLAFAEGERFSGPNLARAYFYPPSPVLALAELGEASWQNLEQQVDPGEIVDVPLLMRAPDQPGIYRSYWRLQDDDGAELALFWVVGVVEETAKRPETDWSGEWLHINTHFVDDVVDPGKLVLQQTDGEILGYFYPIGGSSKGDLVYVQGKLSDERQRVEGLFGMLWDQPVDFRWTLEANQNQFEGQIYPDPPQADGCWSGGRAGRVPPICLP